MGLICPACGVDSDDLVRASLGVPPDARSDDIVIQVLKCGSCGFLGVGVYEESRRGSMDSESVDHYGYHLAAKEWAGLEKQIMACPDPGNSRCGCPSHRLLRGQDESGRWLGLSGFELGAYFPMGYQE